jgi:hypothetical protein
MLLVTEFGDELPCHRARPAAMSTSVMRPWRIRLLGRLCLDGRCYLGSAEALDSRDRYVAILDGTVVMDPVMMRSPARSC